MAAQRCGTSRSGQLGNGTGKASSQPVKVSLPAGDVATGISATVLTGYAVTTTGQVLAWGSDDNGALGNGSSTVSDVPVVVARPVEQRELTGRADLQALLAIGGAKGQIQIVTRPGRRRQRADQAATELGGAGNGAAQVDDAVLDAVTGISGSAEESRRWRTASRPLGRSGQ